MFVLDTNVVSELRNPARANTGVREWAAAQASHHLFISAVTVLEIETGVLLKERKDAVQGAMLRRWLNEQFLPAFADRVIAIDTPVARLCAKLHVPDPKSDRDALIAASAIVHGMTVVTRNMSDFSAMGASLFDPWTKQ